MVSLSSHLAANQFAQMDTEERLYDWYALLGDPQANFAEADHFSPVVIQEEKGWSAYVWCIYNEGGDVCHYHRHLIRKGFRTQQLAKITANYFILHSLINKTNEASTDQSAML